MGTLPEEILTEAQVLYRRTLAEAVPEAGDDTIFSFHLLCACARWLLSGDALVPCAQRGASDRLAALATADWHWGLATARQRFLHRLRVFMRLSEVVDEFPGFTATIAGLHRVLLSRWPPEVHTLNVFPAFKDQ